MNKQVTTADPMSHMIERVLKDDSISMDRLEKLLDMQERVQRKSEKAAHIDALASAMSEMPTVPMNGRGHNGRPYATLKDITTTTRPVLAAHGLTLTFDTDNNDNTVTVVAILAHRLGHETSVKITLPADTSGSKAAVQAIGSSQTYGQRYTAQSILGLSMGDDMDDDGVLKDTATIDDDQYRDLRAKIDEAGGDDSALLKFYKVEELTDLPRTKFGHATAMLNAKIKKAAA